MPGTCCGTGCPQSLSASSTLGAKRRCSVDAAPALILKTSNSKLLEVLSLIRNRGKTSQYRISASVRKCGWVPQSGLPFSPCCRLDGITGHPQLEGAWSTVPCKGAAEAVEGEFPRGRPCCFYGHSPLPQGPGWRSQAHPYSKAQQLRDIWCCPKEGSRKLATSLPALQGLPSRGNPGVQEPWEPGPRWMGPPPAPAD